MSERKEKFTSGPWEAGRNPAMATVLDGEEGKAIYQKGGCHHIAWANIHDGEGKLDMETALANAALIAAAPEMYNMLDMLASCGCIPTGTTYNAAIRKLLAKARGEGDKIRRATDGD